MKKAIFIPILLIISFVVNAQSTFAITEGPSALVYSLPKTKLSIELELEKVSQKPGVFYRYSERYLATTNIITQEKISYRLKSVLVNTIAIPDTSRTFQITPDKNSQLTHLNTNAEGILRGVNLPFLPVKGLISAKKNQTSIVATNQLLPLGEEYMMAGSEAKLAEGAAKQIYRIRESRMGLLTADVEKLPADGASMKLMLDGLDKMERQLTELFVGTTKTEVQTHKIFLIPTTAINKDVLFRLSALRGLVAADDLSGVPYYITLKPQYISATEANPKVKPEKAGLYYILPATTELTVSDGINNYYNGQFLIPQFGTTVPLPESLFKQAHIKVFVDQNTGRLITIE